MTEVTTEMPRSRSTAIQSERVARRSRLALTWPASWIAPPNSRSFSVSVVLPASGWEMMAKVRRRSTSVASADRAGAPSGARIGMFMAGWMWQFPPLRSRSGCPNRAGLGPALQSAGIQRHGHGRVGRGGNLLGSLDVGLLRDRLPVANLVRDQRPEL